MGACTRCRRREPQTPLSVSGVAMYIQVKAPSMGAFCSFFYVRIDALIRIFNDFAASFPVDRFTDGAAHSGQLFDLKLFIDVENCHVLLQIRAEAHSNSLPQRFAVVWPVCFEEYFENSLETHSVFYDFLHLLRPWVLLGQLYAGSMKISKRLNHRLHEGHSAKEEQGDSVNCGETQ